MEFICKIMELDIMEIGKMICNMDKDMKYGNVDLFMMVCIKMERNMVLEHIKWRINLVIQANGKKIKYKDLVIIYLMMGNNIKGNGKIT